MCICVEVFCLHMCFVHLRDQLQVISSYCVCILGIEPWSSRKLASTLSHISSPTFFTILAIAGVLCAPFLIAWSLWLRQLSAVLKHMLLRQCADYLAAFSLKLEFYSEGRHYST